MKKNDPNKVTDNGKDKGKHKKLSTEKTTNDPSQQMVTNTGATTGSKEGEADAASG